MKDSVLISIKPRWCELIASGKKTIEVRKTAPKIETPFKCYIYCTKPSRSKMWRAGEYMCFNDDELYRDTKGKIKYGCSIELMACDDYTEDNFLNGKVIGEFVCDRITEIHLTDEGYDFDVPKMTGMKYEEMEAYFGRKNGYGWHISDLLIYDRPKKLSEFVTGSSVFTYNEDGNIVYSGMKRPPQSWCYVWPAPF